MRIKNKSYCFTLFILILVSMLYTNTSNLVYANLPKLDLSTINNYWNNRESESVQKDIIQYLTNKPEIIEDYETAWKTARLVYFIGNYGIGKSQFVDTKAGVELFNYGVMAAKMAISINPDKVEGYYWHAIDLGSWGLAKGVLASAIYAKDGMRSLEKAFSIDPMYHWCGSSRILGRYYQELPGLFGGSNDKARELFLKATNSCGDYDNNWVYLGQFYNHMGEYKLALDACNKALLMKNQDGKHEEIRYKDEAKACMIKAQNKLS